MNAFTKSRGAAPQARVQLPRKLRTRRMKILSRILPLIAALAASASAQTVYYWDVNGSTNGFGNSPRDGTWGVSSFWTTSASGNIATVAWPNNARPSTPDQARFDGGNGTITVSGTQTASLFRVANGGNYVLTNGTIRLQTANFNTGINVSAFDNDNNNHMAVNSAIELADDGGSGTRELNITAGRSSGAAGTNSITINGSITGAIASRAQRVLVQPLRASTSGVTTITFGSNSVIANGTSTSLNMEYGTRLADANSGRVVIGATNNTYTGETRVGSGTIVVNANAPSGSAGSLGNTTGAINVGYGQLLTSSTARLLIGAAGVAIGRNIDVLHGASSNSTFGVVFGGENTAGTATFSGVIDLASTSAATNRTTVVQLTAAAGGQVDFTGRFTNSKAGSSVPLEKIGDGTVRLSASNSHSGGTTLSAGTLLGGNNNAFGTGTLNLNAGTLAADSSTARAFTNDVVIGGNVTFGQAGGGTGALTFSNADLGTSVRTLTVSNSSTTFVGVVSNTGGITKAGAGTLTLSGANTYTGATTINAGTLQIGDGGTTGSIASTSGINNNGTLAYNRSDNLSASYAISGNGNVTKAGAGTLTLFGANSYSGGTLLSAGALKGDTTSLQGAITNNAAAIFDAATNGTYAGVMSGTGTVAKSGAGTLTLTATNSYNGSTTVEAGKLVVNGAISNSAVTVRSNAVLGGSGSVGSTIIANGATIAPGNSPGTLSINGDLVWSNGGNYDWEVFKVAQNGGVAGTDWDLINISGALDLTNLSGAPYFNINLLSLSGTNTPGALAGFTNTSNYSWQIAGAGSPVNTNYFNYININTTNFASYNNIGSGLFALELRNGGKDLYLTYSSGAPVPEPGTWAAAALLALAAGCAARRRASRPIRLNAFNNRRDARENFPA